MKALYRLSDLRDGGMQFFPMCLKVCLIRLRCYENNFFLKIDTVCMLLMEMEKYRQYPVNALLQEQVKNQE